MNAVTQPVGVKPAQTPPPGALREWLDLLANGKCDAPAFLQSMQTRFQSEPDENWEVLSQLDQYYRRGKIKPEVFLEVKTALAGYALGVVDSGVSTPPAAARVRSTPQPQSEGPEVRLGDVLRGRYRIEGLLGQGGMGAVFEALDAYRLDIPPSGQRLAIKVLHTAVTMRAELLTELRREFQHLQLLSHPNIVRVYEFDRDGPRAFFTMELLNGVLLSRVLQARKRVPLERPQALAVIRDVGAAIAHAHSRGIVHGDINPQNIFITSRGELRVLDFGASHKLVAGAAQNDGKAPASFATPGYASCQVLEGERSDTRDDVFALACVAYLLLCGNHPFPQYTALEARARRLTARRPARLSNRQWRALRAGLNWEREKRPADIQEWLQQLNLHDAAKSLVELTELMEAPTPKQSNIALKLAALTAVAAVLGAGFLFVRQRARLPNVSAVASHVSVDRASAPARIDAPSAHLGATATADLARPLPAQPPVTATVAPATKSSATPSDPASAAAAWPAKIEMLADTVDVPAADSSALVVVRRKGNLHGRTGFTWWTESGTAKPGTDFQPVVPRAERFEDGKSSISLNIPLAGTMRSQPKSFYVLIDMPEDGAKLGARVITMVTLLPTNPQ